MIVTHTIRMDLDRHSLMPCVNVVQDDKYSRNLKICLYANSKPFNLPTLSNVLVHYCKPDHTKGMYDTLPDGTCAWSTSKNTVTVALAPQVCTAAGKVVLSVTLLSGAAELHCFNICLDVQSLPDGIMASNTYINIAGFVPQPDNAKNGQYLAVGEVSEDGKIAALKTVDTSEAIYHYAQDGGYTGTEEDFAKKLAAEIDTTLTKSGAMADAKAVGDIFHDIQLGYDGKTYDSAGGAVRSQAQQLANSMGNVLNGLAGIRDSVASRNLYNKDTILVNKSINRAGELIESYYSDLSDYILVEPGRNIYFSDHGAQFQQTYKIKYVYGFDAEKNLIDYRITAEVIGLVYAVPEQVRYIRICLDHSVSEWLQVEYDEVTGHAAFSTNVALESVQKDMPRNLLRCDKSDASIFGLNFVRYGDDRIQIVGTATSDVWMDYYYADIREIDVNQNLTLSGSTDQVHLHGYFRETRNSTSALSSITAVNETPVTFNKRVVSDPSKAAVLTVSLHIRSGTTLSTIVKPMLEYGEKVHPYLQNGTVMSLKQYTDLATVADNSYQYAMISKAVFCGDSVTEGYVVDGDIYGVESKYAYPTQFGRLHPAIEVTNMGSTGISPTQYLNTVYPGVDFSQYDLIVVELGYNGSDYGYLNMGEYDTEGTNTYSYRKLVQNIRSQNSDAVIVLVGSSQSVNTGGDGDWLPILKKMAQESSCKVINLRDSKYLDLNNDSYHGTHDGVMDYIHFNRQGYNAKAYVVSRMIADVLNS